MSYVSDISSPSSSIDPSNIVLDENQKLRAKVATLETTINILQDKETILTDLFETHKAKYDQMQIHFNQKHEELKLRYQQLINNLQNQIDYQQVGLKQKQIEMVAKSCNYCADITKCKQSIKSLKNQINDKDTEIHKLNQEISDIEIELTETNKELLQKDAEIDSLYQKFKTADYYRHNEARPLSAANTIKMTFSRSTRKLSECSASGTTNVNISVTQNYNDISMLSPLMSRSHEHDDELDRMSYDDDILSGSEDECSPLPPNRDRSISAYVIRNSETDISLDIDNSEMVGHKSV